MDIYHSFSDDLQGNTLNIVCFHNDYWLKNTTIFVKFSWCLSLFILIQFNRSKILTIPEVNDFQ